MTRKSLFDDILPYKMSTDYFPKRHLMDAMFRTTMEYDAINREVVSRSVHMKRDELVAAHKRMRHLNVLRRNYMRRLAFLENSERHTCYTTCHIDQSYDEWFPVNVIITMALVMVIMLFVGHIRMMVGY